MKRMNERILLAGVLLFIAAYFISCEDEERSQDNLALLSGASGLLGSSDLFVVQSSPVQQQTGVSETQTIELIFSRTIHTSRCIAAFTLNGTTDGTFTAGGNALKFVPSSALGNGTHTAQLTTDCEDLEGKNLLTSYTLNFSVGENTAPSVQAVGVASQGCPTTYPGTGSSSGGDHTMGSCWWDSSLAMLTPTNYEFRGGDDGTGIAGSTNACSDVNTDNFRIIFTEYMDTSITTGAISLIRLSGPSSTMKLASHTWTDCQGSPPYGCRVVTLSFSELEATCNDVVAFGNTTTGGDFNLQQTDNPPAANFPLYRLEVATTARNTAGLTLGSTFAFDMEGN